MLVVDLWMVLKLESWDFHLAGYEELWVWLQMEDTKKIQITCTVGGKMMIKHSMWPCRSFRQTQMGTVSDDRWGEWVTSMNLCILYIYIIQLYIHQLERDLVVLPRFVLIYCNFLNANYSKLTTS